MTTIGDGEEVTETQYDFSEEHAEKETFIVSRIYTVSPREGERYFLRLLLHHVTGATKFEDLRTVEDTEHPSFREACFHRGVLSDDTEWKKCLEDTFRSSFVPLTELFSTIMVHCNPSSPATIYTEKLGILIQDIRNRYRGPHNRGNRRLLETDRSAESYVLMEIAEYLRKMNGLSLGQYGLPLPDRYLPPLEDVEQFNTVQPESDDDLWNEVQDCVGKFNNDQKHLFNKIIGAIAPGTTADNIQPHEAQNSDDEAEGNAPMHSEIPEDDEYELDERRQLVMRL